MNALHGLAAIGAAIGIAKFSKEDLNDRVTNDIMRFNSESREARREAREGNCQGAISRFGVAHLLAGKIHVNVNLLRESEDWSERGAKAVLDENTRQILALWKAIREKCL